MKIGAVVLVLCLGLWGCARKPASQAGDTNALESKVTKLEQDLRTTANARDKVRKELELESARYSKTSLICICILFFIFVLTTPTLPFIHSYMLQLRDPQDNLNNMLLVNNMFGFSVVGLSIGLS